MMIEASKLTVHHTIVIESKAAGIRYLPIRSINRNESYTVIVANGKQYTVSNNSQIKVRD